MNENEYISRLKARDIRPTALRLLILRTMAGFDRAFSLADLEEELDTVDKSTLFRTLTLFWRITWCTASTTAPVRSNMRFAAAIAIVKSTTCIPISIARIAGVPFACEGGCSAGGSAGRIFGRNDQFRYQGDLRRLFGAELTGWIEAACLNDEAPSAPVGNGQLKVREFPEAPFPQRMSAGGEPVADQRRAAIRNAGFGVELHAVYRQVPVIKDMMCPASSCELAISSSGIESGSTIHEW